jgi:ankyrin repeat protein
MLLIVRWSLLQAAVINQNLAMVELLLSYGAEINFLDKSHQTALHYAASFGYTNGMN